MPPPIAPWAARRYGRCMSATILSILMLAGIALSVGGLMMIVKKRDHQKGWLMIAAAVVMFANVLIWALPMG